jgi:hypothetical protein
MKFTCINAISKDEMNSNVSKVDDEVKESKFRTSRSEMRLKLLRKWGRAARR